MLSCMMCWCLFASAQKQRTLDNIEVVSRHTFSDIIPNQTLKGKELEKLNALSVADALRYFSGLQIKDYGGVGGLKTVNIRSMGSQHLGVYYDGIQLGNAQNGQIDLGQFALDNVEEISLYNGQKSSLMQTASDYGNAGNVYIRTRMPKFVGDERTHFRGKVKYGSSNMLQLAALLEQKFSDKVSASFNLGTTSTASSNAAHGISRHTPTSQTAAFRGLSSTMCGKGQNVRWTATPSSKGLTRRTLPTGILSA